MPLWGILWLSVVTIALIAHMYKDYTEFKKIARLEEEIAKLKKA
mgnify:CR=1 FL=1